MTDLTAPPERQHSLFESLPTTEPRRRRVRSQPQPVDPVLPPCPSEAVPESFRPVAPVIMRLDAAALTRPDLSDLVRDLSEPNLGFLLVEAAREVKRRLIPDDREEYQDSAPNPQLLRAVRSVIAELAENEADTPHSL